MTSEYGIFKDNLDKYLSDTNKRNRPIDVCTTPKSLLAIGAKNLPVVMNPNDIDKCLASREANKNKNSHNLSVDELTKLPELIADPMMIFKGQKEGYITVVTDVLDQNGNPFVVGVELDIQEKNHRVNRIASMHGRERASKNFIASNGKEVKGFIPRNIEEGNIISLNKEKATNFLRSTGLQLPEGKEFATSENIITDISE